MIYQIAFSLKAVPKSIPVTGSDRRGLTSYSGKTTHSVTTLSIDFDSTCSSRFGNELNVESVPLNLATTIHVSISNESESLNPVRPPGVSASEVTCPWMKTTSSKSGGNGLINAPELSPSAGALGLVESEVGDEPAIVKPEEVVFVAAASEEYK